MQGEGHRGERQRDRDLSGKSDENGSADDQRDAADEASGNYVAQSAWAYAGDARHGVVLQNRVGVQVWMRRCVLTRDATTLVSATALAANRLVR